MKALKIIFGILILLIIAFFMIGLFLPSEIAVERSIDIQAQPTDIHPYLNDFRNWQKWSAWAKRDTNLTSIYEGAPSGEGSVYKWSGNAEAGSGVLRITRSDSSEGVWYDMSMNEGQFQSEGAITYEPLGDSTRVVWSYHSDVGGNILYKYVMVFFKPYIEHDFDEGLWGLKELVEAEAVE